MTRMTLMLTGLIALAVLLAGCAPEVSSFARDDVDYSFIRRAAVYPFQNRSQDLQAGVRVHSIFLSELLQQDALRTIDPGETLGGIAALRLDTVGELTPEQIVDLGRELEVDAIFFGDVEEYGADRVSNDRVNLVTLTFSMAETQTGSVVWRSTVHRNGTSFWRKLFGGGSASLHDVTRAAVRESLETLF